jgi:hypothetical protein
MPKTTTIGQLKRVFNVFCNIIIIIIIIRTLTRAMHESISYEMIVIIMQFGIPSQNENI